MQTRHLSERFVDEVLTECGYDPASVHGRVQEFYEVSDSEEEVSDCEKEVSNTDEESR